MSTDLRFVSCSDALSDFETLVLIGRSERLQADDVYGHLEALIDRKLWTDMVSNVSPGDDGGSTQTWVSTGDKSCKLVVGVMPEGGSRHNSPARPHSVTDLVRGAIGSGRTSVVLALSDAEHALASGTAVARACPHYSRKKKSDEEEPGTVSIAFQAPGGEPDVDTDRLDAICHGIRTAARLVDMPTSELNTTAFVAEARKLIDGTNATFEVIQGDELENLGFGGLWNVGKTALNPPALVIMRYKPESAGDDVEHVTWVGKGIVYDTGGLSLKTKGHMAGMKCDMGGAAAVMGGFVAAVKTKPDIAITALLCLAENAIGPRSFRPDDIIQLYSGKTVEVNNTDAEGRLVLGDGVAYASKHLKPDVIVDLATLTGAQLVATGKRHAAIVCNDDDLELEAIATGKRTGDLVHPLPYAPEFFRAEFKSKVADLKNSVKDRMNGQSSCAGQFVAEHLVDYEGKWLHVDLAGPSFIDERGTGYGVALLVELFT